MSTAVQEFALALMRAKAIKSSSTNDFIKAHADALQMEKEQIIESVVNTVKIGTEKEGILIFTNEDEIAVKNHAEQYYNETYQQSHTPKHYRVWFPDIMEAVGGYWWNAVTDPCGRLYDRNHPNDERDTLEWYLQNGYKVEEVTND